MTTTKDHLLQTLVSEYEPKVSFVLPTVYDLVLNADPARYAHLKEPEASIRRDLQELRDEGYVTFIDYEGTYHLNSDTTKTKVYCFTQELLESCRNSAPRIEKFLKNYGELAEPQLQLIPLDEIHGLDPIQNQKTGRVNPRGFQVRSEEDIDSNVVDDMVEDILNLDWDPTAHQPVFFALGEEWRYGNKKWGIANGNHRYTAAIKAGETYIIGWVIKIDLKYLRKWVTAEANRQLLASKPRSDRDIVYSIKHDVHDPESDLYKKLNADDVDNSEYHRIILAEVKEYNVSRQKAESIVRQVIHEADLTPDRKQWQKDQALQFIDELSPTWTKLKHPIYNYQTPNGDFVVYVQDEGYGVHQVAQAWCSHVLSSNKDKQLIVVFSSAKKANVTKENRAEHRRNFITKVNQVMENYWNAGNLIFGQMCAINPKYVSLAEFDDEKGYQPVY